MKQWEGLLALRTPSVLLAFVQCSRTVGRAGFHDYEHSVKIQLFAIIWYGPSASVALQRHLLSISLNWVRLNERCFWSMAPGNSTVCVHPLLGRTETTSRQFGMPQARWRPGRREVDGYVTRWIEGHTGKWMNNSCRRMGDRQMKRYANGRTVVWKSEKWMDCLTDEVTDGCMMGG